MLKIYNEIKLPPIEILELHGLFAYICIFILISTLR